MGYENPRDRLELFLKKIIDKSTAPAERRTRFEQFLAGILDGSLVPDDPRTRLELYLKGVAESGGYIPPSGTLTITENGIYDVETKKYVNVQVPAPTPQADPLSITIGAVGNQIVTYYPGYGKTYSDVTLYRDDNVIAPGNIKKDVVIFGVTGTYEGGGGGTLLTDVRNIVVGSSSTTVTLGWQPDKLIFSWVHYEAGGEDPYYEQCYSVLTGSGSIVPGADTITFTSTGYTAVIDGTYWNDPDYTPAGEITVTAIKLS